MERRQWPLYAYGYGDRNIPFGIVAWFRPRKFLRLPIPQFFASNSTVIALLSMVLIGTGIPALQEEDLLEITPLAIPRIELLGISPSLRSTGGQFIVILFVAASMAANSRSQQMNVAAK
jgi:high-affinity iron transporter